MQWAGSSALFTHTPASSASRYTSGVDVAVTGGGHHEAVPGCLPGVGKAQVDGEMRSLEPGEGAIRARTPMATWASGATTVTAAPQLEQAGDLPGRHPPTAHHQAGPAGNDQTDGVQGSTPDIHAVTGRRRRPGKRVES